MTRRYEGHYTDKNGHNHKINPEIAERAEKVSIGKEMSCVAAFKLVNELNVEPSDVGVTLDFLEIKIIKCQLGIFGYGKAKKIVKPMGLVPESLEKEIRENLIDGKLWCKNAWKIADSKRLPRMEITSACNALGIKISPCQLGAF
jgi:hypothetical protein